MLRPCRWTWQRTHSKCTTRSPQVSIACTFSQRNLALDPRALFSCIYSVLSYFRDVKICRRCSSAGRYSATANGYGDHIMRGNEAHHLIPRDQLDENAMENRVARIETDIANIQLDIREFRKGAQAANEAIADVRNAVAVLDGKVNTLAATLTAKVGELSAKLDAKSEATDAKLGSQAEATNVKIAALDARLASYAETVDARFDTLEVKIDSNAREADTRFTALESKIDSNAKATDSKFAALDTKVEKLDARVTLTNETLGVMGQQMAHLDGMVKAIRWMLGAVVALLTLVPIGFTIAKALHWF